MIEIIVPTFGRPNRLAPLLDNLAKTTPPRSYWVLFVVDPDDTPTWEALEDLVGFTALEHAGTYPAKVNAGVRASQADWLLLTADDVVFGEGWLEAAMAHAREDVGVIGTNDLHNPAVQQGDYATQILVARWYVELGTIDEPGKVFCEGYHHNGVDVELCETAKARGAYAHAHDSVIEHLHPTWGKGERDATYERGCFAEVGADEALLRARRALWAG